MGHVRDYRGKLYLVFRDAAGRRRQMAWHGSRRDGAKVLVAIETNVDRERLGVPMPKRVVVQSLSEIKDGFKAHVQSRCRPRTWERYALGLRDVLGFLAERGNRLERAADVTLDDLTAYVGARRAAGAAVATVNANAGAVKALFNWAVREGKLAANPVKAWRPLKAEGQRERIALTDHEIARLLAASPPELADLWGFMLGTGLRSGELSALEWRDVLWPARTVRVRAEVSKSHRAREVDLREDLLPVLRRQQQRRAAMGLGNAPSDRVFANSKGRPWTRGRLAACLKPCLARARLPMETVPHCLRHSFGSHLISRGVNVKTVQRLLGHASATMTLDVYAHELSREDGRRAVALVPLPDVADVARPARHRRAVGEG